MPSEREYPMVQGIRVDIQALRALGHRCAPETCQWSNSCCRTYEVLVEKKEMAPIVGSLEAAAKYAPHLREDDSFIDPFDETEGGNCLATDEEGGCVFAYQKPGGGVWCSLHSAAEDMGVAHNAVKPMPCVLWPLFLHEVEPPLLTVQNEATQFPCNSLRTTAKAPLDEGVAGLIEAVFGREFLDGVIELIAASR